MSIYEFSGHKFDRYDLVTIDITNACNLRCPFCLTDWANVGDKRFMSEAIFDRFVEIMPLIKDGPACYFACLFESFLHPEILRYLNKISQDQRKKAFITTNLSINMSDELIEGLACSGIHHVTVSLDSVTPVIFETMRKGARYDVFQNNLERMASAFARNKDAPELHSFTNLCKLNLGEAADVLKTVKERYKFSHAEFRPVWQLEHTAKWLEDKYISDLEYKELKADLSATGLPFVLEPPYPQALFMQKTDLVENVPPFAALRFLSDGTVDVLNRDVLFNLNDIQNPYNFFKDLLVFLSLDYARAVRIRDLKANQCQAFRKGVTDVGKLNRVVCSGINAAKALYKRVGLRTRI